MITATDSREQVKIDLCNYLTNTANVNDREILRKAVNLIKKIAEDWAINDDEMLTQSLSHSFAVRHHNFLKSIISRLEAIQEKEWEIEEETEGKVAQSLEDQRYNIFKDDYEYDYVEGEVIVFEDHIEVQAIGFVEGFKDYLPKGGKYRGKGCWFFPLSVRAEFGNELMWRKCPILFVSENCK